MSNSPASNLSALETTAKTGAAAAFLATVGRGNSAAPGSDLFADLLTDGASANTHSNPVRAPVATQTDAAGISHSAAKTKDAVGNARVASSASASNRPLARRPIDDASIAKDRRDRKHAKADGHSKENGPSDLVATTLAPQTTVQPNAPAGAASPAASTAFQSDATTDTSGVAAAPTASDPNPSDPAATNAASSASTYADVSAALLPPDAIAGSTDANPGSSGSDLSKTDVPNANIADIQLPDAKAQPQNLISVPTGQQAQNGNNASTDIFATDINNPDASTSPSETNSLNSASTQTARSVVRNTSIPLVLAEAAQAGQVADDAKTADAVTAAAVPDAALTTSADAAAKPAATVSKTDATPSDPSTTSAIDDFFNLLTPAASTSAASPEPASLILAATRKGDAGAGGDQQDNNAATSRHAGVSNTSTGLLTAGDTGKSANPYSFASQLTAARATAATTASHALEQIVVQLNRNAKAGQDQFTVQLHPADLGRVSVKLDFSGDGKVAGTVVADNPETLNLLLKDVRSLERALQDAGLRADPGSLQFNLSGQSGQNSGSPDRGPSTSANTNDADGIEAGSVTATAAETYYLTPGGVNLRV